MASAAIMCRKLRPDQFWREFDSLRARQFAPTAEIRSLELLVLTDLVERYRPGEIYAELEAPAAAAIERHTYSTMERLERLLIRRRQREIRFVTDSARLLFEIV